MRIPVYSACSFVLAAFFEFYLLSGVIPLYPACGLLLLTSTGVHGGFGEGDIFWYLMITR